MTAPFDPAGFPLGLDEAGPNDGHDRLECPWCGEEFGTLPTHMRACEEVPDDG